MDNQYHPSEKQRLFFEEHILGEDPTILTLKRVYQKDRGFSANIRGPFKLATYKFNRHNETVIDASWAGEPESLAHVHCCWSEVLFAKLTPTNQVVRENIKY